VGSPSKVAKHQTVAQLTNLQDSFPKVLPEPAFVRALHMERRRSERSEQSFLLMLVDLTTLLADPNGDTAVGKIVRALPSVARDTDACGWFTQNAILAIIFIAIPPERRELANDVIKLKTWATLRQELGVDQLARIRLSFEFFPEVQDKKPPTPADRRLHSEVRPNASASRTSHAIKRVVDILGSLTALILLSPLFGLIAVIIKLTSKGPILFRQTRIGQYGSPFTFLKFRSMYADNNPEIHQEYVKRFIAGHVNLDASKSSEPRVYKLTSDPRIVPFGRFLRRTSLDELPQFWNVLRGEMSLVGPRPPTMYELELYQPWHRRRMEARPGITGLWQVNGRSKVAFDDMVRLDLRYAKTWSLWLDFQIILRTPRVLLSGEGAY